VGFISLGCPKNLVDSEVMMGLLDRAGARLTPNPEEAEILIVNTCSFIDTAKQESIDTILEMARYKTSGRARKLIVAGCLVEPKSTPSSAPANWNPFSKPRASHLRQPRRRSSTF
jgi:ribosomal protein S12 methylthiotransferase